MQHVTLFPETLLTLSNAMAPYILFGLLFAGFLHVFVPETLVTKHLGKESVSSVIKATLFGIPLPVCSCGVIPLAAGMKKSGASKGATLSFLISTPITGIDSILATYGIFGWVFTLYRVIASIIIALVAGILTNLFDTKESKNNTSSFSVSKPVQTFSAVHATHQEEEASCCSSASCDTQHKEFWLSSALRYAFITLLGDIAKPLTWGLLVGAVITVAIPENLSDILTQYQWLSYLIVIVIAVPMYVCATASLPIAAGLMLSGVSAGAAFVFLCAGPATNTVTIGVVKKMLGTRSLMIYLGSIILGSVAFGVGLDAIFSASSLDPTTLVHMHEEAGAISMLSSVVLWGLVFYLLAKRKA